MRRNVVPFGLNALAVLFVATQLQCAPPQAGSPPANSNPSSASQPAAQTSPEAPVAPTRATFVSQSSDADEQAIRDLIDRMVKVFNAGNAQELANLFTVDAELVDEAGAVTHGRKAIGESFAALFKEHPQAQLHVEVTSIRTLAPGLAVEEGYSTLLHKPDEVVHPTRYSVLHVKQEGTWRMARAHDLSDEQATGADALEQLAWLVGEWQDESPQALVKTSYRWDDNRVFLLGEFTIHLAGRPAMYGTQRIGWDPLAGKLRSWVFDSAGGFGEGLWTRHDDRWIVKTSGVTRDGKAGSATMVYRQLGPGRFSILSRDRTVGGELVADSNEVIVARQPPKPGE